MSGAMGEDSNLHGYCSHWYLKERVYQFRHLGKMTTLREAQKLAHCPGLVKRTLAGCWNTGGQMSDHE